MKANLLGPGALLTITLSSIAPSFARPYQYMNGFSYSGSAKECLLSAEKVLKKAGFSRDLLTELFEDKMTGLGGTVEGYLKDLPVVASIECNQREGISVLAVSGLDADITYEKYELLFDAEW